MRNLLTGLLLMSSFALFAAQGFASEKVPNHPLVIVLLGAPGSGKGTQATRIAEHCRVPHISTGDLFRANIRENTPLGQKAKSYIDQGKLVPDAVVIDMVKDRVSQPDSRRGYLLDGFPRTLAQGETLTALLGEQANVIVLHLDVSDRTIKERIASRGEGRSDDAPEVVQKRLDVYHEQTKPLIEYYRNQGLLRDINGEQSPERVFAAIAAILPC